MSISTVNPKFNKAFNAIKALNSPSQQYLHYDDYEPNDEVVDLLNLIVKSSFARRLAKIKKCSVCKQTNKKYICRTCNPDGFSCVVCGEQIQVGFSDCNECSQNT